ncbi:MAG: Yip1 family protein [Methanomicrobium sp.]|nr:Yip1 family protein [Methanomicrobium sp.]
MIPVKEILLSPAIFFEELRQKPESLKFPALIILIAGIIGGISAAFAASASVAILPAEAAFLSGILPVAGFIITVIGTFIAWIIWAGIMHIISSLLKGTGSFNRSLEITGYGMIPQILGSLISTVLIYMHLSSLSLSPVTSQAEIEAATILMSTGPLMQAATLVGVIFLIWSVNIWIFGFMKCRKLSTKNAALAAGIPAVVYILITIMFL